MKNDRFLRGAIARLQLQQVLARTPTGILLQEVSRDKCLHVRQPGFSCKRYPVTMELPITTSTTRSSRHSDILYDIDVYFLTYFMFLLLYSTFASEVISPSHDLYGRCDLSL